MSPNSPSQPAPMALVSTSLGVLRGNATASYREFLGIDFAAQPVGPLRFLHPRPAEKWTGERDATRKGKWSPQFDRPVIRLLEEAASELAGPHGVVQGEDCLNLNVYTPADVGAGGLPVLVWIHGGAFRGGSGSMASSDGRAFVSAHRVVLVAVNYRLSSFGFLASKELMEVCGEVNLGLLDQIEALRWVKREIAAFGGDPANVTVFGESAGAISIHALMLWGPCGLFRRAFLASGVMGTNAPPPVSTAPQRYFDALCAELGINNKALSSKETVERLRAVPADEFFAATVKVGDRTRYAFGPVWDGKFVSGNYIRMMDRNEYDPGVEAIVLGDMEDEGSVFAFGDGLTTPAKLKAFAKAIAGKDAATASWLAQRYPSTPDPLDSGTRLFADYLFHAPTAVVAGQLARNPRVKVFCYRWAWTWSRTAHLGFGAYHGSDVPFFFNQAALCGKREGYLAAAFSGALARFAQGGDPGNGWASYTKDDPRILLFDGRGRIRMAVEGEIAGRGDRGAVEMWDGWARRRLQGWEAIAAKARM
ncbi:Alpha/Beta hydrolase protein [Hyaloraphidium curvatum]|nr:Alpha/Beta hydrolase protein [Hyaloraphidium curvatum]